LKNTIQQFMWGYQRHIRSSLNESAKELFERMDPRLAPELFFVGVLKGLRDDRHTICVEPEEDYWISAADFAGLEQSSHDFLKAYPESQLRHSHPVAEDAHENQLRARSIRDAILQVLDNCKEKHPGRSHFVSYPVYVDGFWVFIVLGLDRQIVESYRSLTTHSYQLHEYREIPLTTSLLHAAAEEFLEFAMSALREPSNPAPFVKDPESLLRAAGAALVRGIAPRVDPDNHWGQALFSAFSTIASLRYEGDPGAGGLILARTDHPAITSVLTFAAPVPLQRFRAVRKLLELAFGDLALLSDCRQVYGLARIDVTKDCREDLFEVRILGHHHWELRYGNQPLTTVRYGLPELPKHPFDEEKLRSDLSRLFGSLSRTSLDNLVTLVRQAERESHGTTLIISETAATEAQRLASQATPISPCELTPDLLTHLTPIDGAILIDPQGVCHAIGVILDGVATPNGDPGRGARFNSAIRYVESQLKASVTCFAIVVSEDRGVDFVPFLRPAIRRSTIDAAIEEIRRQHAGPLKHRRYRRALDWLDKHRFYLREADCAELNVLIPQLEDRFQVESESTIKIVREPFATQLGMDDAFYYSDESNGT
jgi:hypothetical protein